MKRTKIGRGLIGALCSMSLFAASSAEDLFVGDAQKSQKTVQKAVKGLGTIIRKEPTNLYRIKLTAGSDTAAAMKKLKSRGLEYVHKTDCNNVNPKSLPSVKKYISYRRSIMELNNLDEEGSGLDFYEALENYLSVRVNSEGVLDQEAYRRATEHRDQMPMARRDWFSDSNNPGGLFAYVGPKNLDVPYRIYYGTRPLSGRKNDIAYAPVQSFDYLYGICRRWNLENDRWRY